MTKQKQPRAIIKTEDKEIMVTGISAESLISQAITKGVPVETMEKLLSMRRELKAEYAKEQYDKSMAEFQSECPVIKKEKEGGKTRSGIVAYKYAPLDAIITQVKDLIKQHGFSYMIKTRTTEHGITAICIVKHEAGHSEESELEVPSGGGTDIMSAPQKVAAALTFAKRYAFCNAFGILTGDEDKDAGTEVCGEATDELSPEEKFKRTKMMVSGLKTVDSLLDAAERLKTSSLTKEQKSELNGIISIKVDELSK